LEENQGTETRRLEEAESALHVIREAISSSVFCMKRLLLSILFCLLVAVGPKTPVVKASSSIRYGVEVAFPSLTFSSPLGIYHADDGTGRLFVVEQDGLELPIWDYGHDVGYSVTGGFVYRGSTLKELDGAYVYGDYGSGRIWALWYDAATQTVTLNEELVDTDLTIPSFGVDESNDLYVCAFDGKIYRLVHVPSIENVTQQPPAGSVLPNDVVEVYVTVTDVVSPLRRVVLNYTTDIGNWTEFDMTYVDGDLYRGTIPGFPYGTNVTYKVFAEDNSNNSLDTAEVGYVFQYIAIPEYGSPLLVSVLMTVMLVLTLVRRKMSGIRGSIRRCRDILIFRSEV
jgi:hypothetical protein